MRLLIGPTIVDAEIASTPEELTRGLAGHNPLSKGQAMLFVFARADRHNFWMRGVAFPIDIVFVGVDGLVSDIFEGMAPESEKVIAPTVPVQFAIELPSGYARAAGIAIGSKVIAQS